MEIFNYIINEFNVVELSEECLKEIKDKIKYFSMKMNDRWEKCYRKRYIFKKKYDTWLNKNDIEFKIVSENFVSTSVGSGRSMKNFNECSIKTK